MVRLIGACLILFAGTMLGFYQALQLSRRPRQIRQLVQALQRLETEISYGFTPLPSALLTISRQIPQPLSQLFHQVGEQLAGSGELTTEESWRSAIDNCWQHTAMKSTEKEAFLQLGLTLGITDREDQIKHLRLTASQLQTEELTAGEEQKRYEKMWKSLGLLSATLVVILMY
ncbi:stage III sporulation protein AB [Paenibacillus psychroresistens]|uniref:Stage III sporulation protein AB n=1 Tax=Paenibacillus psychroresistens TaxID=1778678 RepID=A0A6B8RMX0_9BACL|nr:stage III sporulation protein SpoIIIAB [Paenibacillus psychroresistens]QGQ97114.1 stage III sporulation protein AB [Paenibacillus psychroresistens]